MTQSKPSKTARKREQQALQNLGEQLIGLGDELIDGLQLDNRLQEAIASARKMKSREALRRQKQYIGKLMREVDTAPIRSLFDRIAADERREKRVFADAERWRDRLIRDRNEALDAFSAATAGPHSELETLLDELDRARNDRLEKDLRKRIFRIVYAALVARAGDG